MHAQPDDVPLVGGKPALLLPPNGKMPKTARPQVEPVVGPNGEFQEPIVDHHGGRALVVRVQGQIILTAYARELGWTLYRDICFGLVPGVEAAPRFWRIYELLSKAREAGRLPARDALAAEKIYHPEVLRRRTDRAGGYERFSAEEFEASLAAFEASIPEDERKRIYARARELGIGEQDDVELEDLLADKPKRGKRG